MANMGYSVYKVTTTFGVFHFAANLVQATAGLFSISDDSENLLDDRTWTCSPYRTADARHEPDRAAELLLASYGREYWLDPSTNVGEDQDGPTFDGRPQADYIRDLITSVEPVK